MILVTGGAGFIGSNFVLQWMEQEKTPLINLDKLTYAGHLLNLETLTSTPLHKFIHGDICDRQLIKRLLKEFNPQYVVHFAAESHVDRSIASPDSFIKTNIVGTFILLEEALQYWQNLPNDQKEEFRFLHVSTDEVYGSVNDKDPPVTEESPYVPNSPYAASKASSDHLVRAYFKTYHLPVLTVHACNNYGPRQFPEKLIPLAIRNAISEKPIPLYGDGLNRRDWIYVDDHCEALKMVLKKGRIGEIYNVSTGVEQTNLAVLKAICHHLDRLKPRKSKESHEKLIQFVRDRPGHDKRYALDSQKIQKELGWQPRGHFDEYLLKTIKWYLDNPLWIDLVTKSAENKLKNIDKGHLW